jgi:membrane associated rhomboid family serine protease
MTDQTAGATAPPLCPRHPDRVSYVRCQRCGRPTCPECQRPAAVGIQCVDCVAAARRAIQAPRTPWGTQVRDGRPIVTMTLIGLCVVSYVLQLATAGAWTDMWIFWPAIGRVEPWRFLTTGFLHSESSIFHLLFNMYALWIVGPELEKMLNRWRYLALYLLSAVAGSVGVLLLADPSALNGSWRTGVVGASGAVFGLFGAILVVMRRLGRDARQIVVVIILNVIIGFTIPNIAWQAHLGGLAMGAALAVAYVHGPVGRRRAVSVVATVAAAFVLLLLALLKYAST